ncbi:hypothetical protein Acid345_3756 [Candidatus Koribacter versatilis Ellin345]|uniref:Uncharacterized protein n=1 Tax=Koribacter versatilis (strain Ellin345) TaxID=204669 RepID=Q1IK44_KORVE|nr:hypothetical protein [Candidatus Koribacter versatilis]ABF42756.1 hypothetical protein Acid345_3756 [Candidatus Koribacter versatilis Ellin345]
MTVLRPWALGPFELILHAEMHYRQGEDFDRRISIVGFDNAIEVAIHTYLSLHPIQRQNRTYPRVNVEVWLENFHTKMDFLEVEIANRGCAIICEKADFIWYHEVRNGQYHVGGATIPQERELEGIRKAALWVFGLLFDVGDVEEILEEYLNKRSGDDSPERTEDNDRLIDQEFGTIKLAGKPYYTSEVLHAYDPVLYSELAIDIRKRDESEAEMGEEAS